MNANSKPAEDQGTGAEETAADPEAAAAETPDAAAAGATSGAAEAAGDPAAGGEAAAAAEPTAEDEIERLKAELAETKDKMMRALAEAENTRRRAERDRQEASKYAIASFAREMLSVADNLSRALAAVDDGVKQSSEAVATLIEGIEMTAREMQNTLERQGIRRIEAEGQILNPNLHEAMFEIPDETKPQGTVVQVVEDGYMLNDRLLRPAKVGVAKTAPGPSGTGEQVDTTA